MLGWHSNHGCVVLCAGCGAGRHSHSAGRFAIRKEATARAVMASKARRARAAGRATRAIQPSANAWIHRSSRTRHTMNAFSSLPTCPSSLAHQTPRRVQQPRASQRVCQRCVLRHQPKRGARQAPHAQADPPATPWTAASRATTASTLRRARLAPSGAPPTRMRQPRRSRTCPRAHRALKTTSPTPRQATPAASHGATARRGRAARRARGRRRRIWSAWRAMRRRARSAAATTLATAVGTRCAAWGAGCEATPTRRPAAA